MTGIGLSGADGYRYRVDVHRPAGPVPAEGWPLLLLVDGWGAFGTACEAMARMAKRPDATGVMPMLIAGLSAADGGYDATRRRHDLTTVGADGRGGGAPAFLDLLTRRLPQTIDAPVDPARTTLFGHSLAGFFTLWTLANRSDAFRNYVAVSPSIWWDPAALATPPEAAGRRAALIVGAWEGALPPWQATAPGADGVRARRAERDMIGTARRHAERLAGRLGEDSVTFDCLDQEDHASIVSAALPRALRLASRR